MVTGQAKNLTIAKDLTVVKELTTVKDSVARVLRPERDTLFPQLFRCRER